MISCVYFINLFEIVKHHRNCKVGQKIITNNYQRHEEYCSDVDGRTVLDYLHDFVPSLNCCALENCQKG